MPYKALVDQLDKSLGVELELMIKEVLQFIKDICTFFYNVKTKGKDRGRVCTKYLILHVVPIEDLIEMIKEEFNKNKLHIKLQAVAHHSTIVTGQFIWLYPKVNIVYLQAFFERYIKKLVQSTPDFALVVKYIFNREKAQKTTKPFINK